MLRRHTSVSICSGFIGSHPLTTHHTLIILQRGCISRIPDPSRFRVIRDLPRLNPRILIRHSHPMLSLPTPTPSPTHHPSPRRRRDRPPPRPHPPLRRHPASRNVVRRRVERAQLDDAVRVELDLVQVERPRPADGRAAGEGGAGGVVVVAVAAEEGGGGRGVGGAAADPEDGDGNEGEDGEGAEDATGDGAGVGGVGREVFGRSASRTAVSIAYFEINSLWILAFGEGEGTYGQE